MKILYILFLYSSLSATVFNYNYIGKLSLFGKVAKASIYYNYDDKKYNIKVVGTGTGIVGKLTKNKKFIYESIGKVKNSKLIPIKYISKESTTDFNSTKIYTFDYQEKKTIVKKNTYEKIKKKVYNWYSFKYDTKIEYIDKNSTKILDEIYQNDMVSVLFNKALNLLQMRIGEEKQISAVGSKDTQKGVIVKLNSIIDKKYIYSVHLKKDYLKGGSANVSFILDSDNILYKAKVDGILFFGNATIKRD